MHRRRRARRAAPPDLFALPPQRPTWDQLPRAVMQTVVTLLAEFLRKGHVPKRFPPGPKEANDE